MFFTGLLAHVLEREAQLVAHLVAHSARDADAARLGQASSRAAMFTPSPKMSSPVDDDVAEIDADAELDALVGRHAGVALRHAALDLDRATHRVDDAGELHQQAVAGGLDDAAAMFGDLRIDQRGEMRLERRERAVLVGAHEPAVAGHVGGQDGRKLRSVRGSCMVQIRPIP